MLYQETPQQKSEPAYLVSIRAQFADIDQAAEEALAALDGKGFCREDLDLLMLGVFNTGSMAGRERKKINQGVAAPLRVPAQHEREAATLEIIPDGITRFFSMDDAQIEKNHAAFAEAAHSTMNELALYTALAETATAALRARGSETERKSATRLRESVDALSEAALFSLPPEAKQQWRQGMENRVSFYRSAMEEKRQRPHGFRIRGADASADMQR